MRNNFVQHVWNEEREQSGAAIKVYIEKYQYAVYISEEKNSSTKKSITKSIYTLHRRR